MYRRCLYVAIAFLLLALFGALPALGDDVVEMTVYELPTCDSCALVKEQILAPILESYGERIKTTVVDISKPEGLGELEAIEARVGRANSPLPVIVIGEEMIASEDPFEVEDLLLALLESRLAPASTETVQTLTETGAAVATSTSEPTASAVQGPAIHVAYVEKDGCEHCARASVALGAVGTEFPDMQVSTFNNMKDAAIIEAMGKHLGLDGTRRLIAPSVYVGSDVLVNDEITSGNLRELVSRYADGGAEPFWETLDVSSGTDSIVGRFRRMGPLAVVLAGLIDGINPCAFATIIFFVSYLAISRRERGALLAVGLAFTAGVFIAYLLVGLGAMRLLQWASTMRTVGLVLYGLMAASCFVLAGISVHDYLLARRGRLGDMRLNLPEQLRERIHLRIRSSRRAFVGTAFVSGMFISILELACTGQVYLPTISFVVGIPEMRVSAVLYLLLYNVFFIVPLLVVLLLTAYGVSAKRFQSWFERNAAMTKLMMAVLFLLLGLLLLSQVLSL